MVRPRSVTARSTGASWMAAKAWSCRPRTMAGTANSSTPARTGTTTETWVCAPMVRAAVMLKTATLIARAKVRHTIGASRNRVSRGEKLVSAHCTTRNGSEKITAVTPRTPKPRVSSMVETWPAAIRGPRSIRGSSRPRARPTTANSSWVRSARARRRRRSGVGLVRARSVATTTSIGVPAATLTRRTIPIRSGSRPTFSAARRSGKCLQAALSVPSAD